MRIISSKYFNFVETALAVGVLAIGALAIVALIPPTLKQDRISTGDFYTADIVSNIQSYITSEAYRDSRWNNATYSSIDNIPTSKPDSIITSSTTWPSAPVSGNLYDFTSSEAGVYGIKFETGDGTDTTIDFSGEILIWKTTTSSSTPLSVPGKLGSPSLTNGSGIPRLLGINVELSYPIEKDYDKRNKNTFYFEIYNSNLQ